MQLQNTKIIHLTDYNLSSTYGFLPYPAPLAFSVAFASLETIGAELPKLLSAKAVREHVKNFRIEWHEDDPAISEADYHYAGRILSFLAHAYIWESPEKPVNILPANFAVPWYKILKKLRRPPVLSYASYALDNWRMLNADKAIELGNIVLLQNFLGGMDEEWFILVHVAIEAKAGKMLESILQAQAACYADDVDQVVEALNSAKETLETICHLLARIPEYCDPYIYYHRVRPYIHGWKNHPMLPDGIYYEGVAAYQGKPQQFRGETGAQSTIIPCLDAAFGITHSNDPLVHYLYEMRTYMPENHRQFLEALEAIKNEENQPLLFTFAHRNKKRAPNLWKVFCCCVQLVAKFRAIHLDFATRYIDKQHQTQNTNPTAVGTGGTPFMRYLRKHLDETTQIIHK